MDETAIPHLARLRSAAALNWTPAANLHITTKFIGEWPEPRLPELQSALAGIPWPENLAIAVSGFELLPRVLFSDVLPTTALIALHRATEDALEALGCAREPRPYRPHITLARIRDQNVGPLRETIASMKKMKTSSSSVVPFEAKGFHLYLSRPNSLYTKLATYP